MVAVQKSPSMNTTALASGKTTPGEPEGSHVLSEVKTAGMHTRTDDFLQVRIHASHARHAVASLFPCQIINALWPLRTFYVELTTCIAQRARHTYVLVHLILKTLCGLEAAGQGGDFPKDPIFEVPESAYPGTSPAR